MSLAQRQDSFLREFSSNGGDTRAACDALGISRNAVYNWNARDPAFAKRYQTVKNAVKAKKIQKELDENVFDPERNMPSVPMFHEFRRTYLGRPVTHHQEPIIRAWEDQTNLVVIVLGPPGSGKDTTAGDIVAQESVLGEKRVAWVMESEKFSRRRFERLSPLFSNPKAYVQPQGPDTSKPQRTLIEDWGPFQWKPGMKYPDGTKVPRPTWTKNEIYFLGFHDEADPNLWATGVTGSMYGSRIDTAVLSDPFTQQNQESPTVKENQLSWIFGTFLSRLDDAGRLLVLGTRVAPGDNYERMMDQLIGDAPVVFQDGYYTKYGNGVATVIYPAIQHDADGNEISYWPDKFPLRSQLILPANKAKSNGKRRSLAERTFFVDELDPDDIHALSEQGARRIRGLYEIRDRDPVMFDIMYQQNPPSDRIGANFTQAILDHCDDPSRTLGVYRPGEMLVLGVDPAQQAGAAWVLWGVNPENHVATVVDYFFAESLGVIGIREKLLIEPTLRYKPRYLCYEVNKESAVLEFPEVQDVLKRTATELVRHSTNINRSQGDFAVSQMVFDMRDGLIRFPAASPADRSRMSLVKEHFKNWDAKNTRADWGRRKLHIPDDIAMASWVAWYRIKETTKRSVRHMQQRVVPQSVQRKWIHRPAPSQGEPRSAPVHDLVAAFFGGEA